MNILLIANKPPYPPKDGGTLATFNMAKVLAENNNITVIAFSTRKHKSNVGDIPSEYASRIRFIYYDFDASVNIFQVLFNLIFSKIPISVIRYYNLKISQKICEHISCEKYDIIQIEGLFIIKYVEEIRKIFNKKIVLRAHNVEHQIWKRDNKSYLNPFKKWYFNNLSKRLKNTELNIVNQIDALISISNQDNEWFMNNGFVKPTIMVPVGFFIENYQTINTNKLVNAISYIGALDWIPTRKG